MFNPDYERFKQSLSKEELKYAPATLFFDGDNSLLVNGTRVSVVGSRNASQKGKEFAKDLSLKLVSECITVVSGLAKGIDTIAHRSAIEAGGRTIAVLGTPLDKAFPIENLELLNVIRKDHLALSQFPIGMPVSKGNFPARNRTMALISDATIIVEAGEASGTVHQGWEAIRLGRLLFIAEEVVNNPNLTWPRKMIDYGAHILALNEIGEAIQMIPQITSPLDFTF
jgi:DNA processing protein